MLRELRYRVSRHRTDCSIVQRVRLRSSLAEGHEFLRGRSNEFLSTIVIIIILYRRCEILSLYFSNVRLIILLWTIDFDTRFEDLLSRR